MHCTKCGSENPAGKKFCGDCGAPLAVDVGTPTAGATIDSIGKGAEISVTEESAVTIVPEGERKTVTALFADIKGSMELMEDLDPEEARAIIDPALRLMIDGVHRYGGYVVQSTGDGIFALFGAPIAHEDHPQRALYAALRMQEDLKSYSQRLLTEIKAPLQVRVGVNTGETVVRSIRTDERHAEYTPIGHSTSLASRMQTLAPIGSIAVTGHTQKLCAGYFVFQALGPIAVRGVSEPVEVFEVTGLGALRTRFHAAAERGLTRFVGREAELAAMRRALERAKAGAGQIVAVVGEAGVGKSRLFHEFRASAREECLVLEAYSVSHGKATDYLPVLDLLSGHFGIASSDEHGQRREKIAQTIMRLDPQLEDTLPYFYGLLGLIEGNDPLAQMDAPIRRRRTHQAIARLLLRESLNRPLVLVFEDLHWIDEETQALLDLLAQGIGHAPVLMLVNYRPEYGDHWGGISYYSQFPIAPLEIDDGQELLTELIGDDPGMGPLKQFVIEKTEGNPFFIEEMVKALFEQKALVRNGAMRLARPLAELKIPPTVQGVLASRIDRLPAAEKELLQTLAVIGKYFPAALVRSVSRRSDQEVDGILQNLQAGDFIHERPAPPDAEYIFKHSLTQEVSYNSMLAERRRLLHERTGLAIETLYSDRLSDHLRELAHHFSRSANTTKAVEYLRMAGGDALQRSAYREAMEHLRLGLKLLETLPADPPRDQQELVMRVSLAWATAYSRGYKVPEVESNLLRARDLCSAGVLPAFHAQVLDGLCFCHAFGARFEMARVVAGEFLALAAKTGDEIANVTSRAQMGIVCAWMGDYRAAAASLEQGIAAGEQLLRGGAPRDANQVMGPVNKVTAGIVMCSTHLCWVLWMLGYPERALRQMQKMLGLARQQSVAAAKASAMHSELALCSDFLRDFTGLQEKAQALIAYTREGGYSLWLSAGTVRLGRILVQAGKFDDGIRTILEGLQMLKAASEQAVYQVFHGVLADACLAAGRYAQGLAAAQETLDHAELDQNRLCEAEVHRVKGELLLGMGAPQSEAEESIRRAIAVAQRQSAKSWELRATTSLARLLIRTGRREEARAMLTGIYNWFTEGFDTADLKEAKVLADELSR